MSRVSEFCSGAPAAAVVRAHLHVGQKRGEIAVDVDEVYGSPAPTERIAARFASLQDDETLLVSLARDGTVVGTGWPVYKENVSLEAGIPDMHEAEAAAMLLSTKCEGDLRALRDQNVHPARISPTSRHGCGCSVAGAPLDGVVLVAVAALVILRARASAGRRRPIRQS